MSEEDQAPGQPSADLNLGPSPKLGPDIEHFVWEPATTQEEEEGSDPLQKPPVIEYENWIVWRSCQVHMPNWWWELVGIQGIDDFQALAQKIKASYEVPQARSKAQKVNNNYSLPPAPKYICQKAFLPPQDWRFPYQDYREGQMQKTIAYTQTLQYWAEKANPPLLGQPCLLVRCVQELRWEMKPYVTFTDGAILEGITPQQELLEGWTRESSQVETPLAPIPKEVKDTPAEELGVPPISQEADEPDTAEEPTDELAVSMATVRELAEGPHTPLCSRRWEKRGKFQVATSPAGQR